MMAQLSVPLHFASEFDVRLDSKELSVEASTLQRGRSKAIMFGQLRSDDPAQGLAIRSTQDNPIRFAVEKINRDDDQDIVSWVLRPTNDAVLAFPNVAGYRMVIFND